VGGGWGWDMTDTVHHLVAVPLVVSTEQKKPRRQRKPSIRTIIKQAEKTGKSVTSITTPDGTVLTFGGEPAKSEGNELDAWMAKHADSTERH
jgi:hypothetical protein